MGNVPLLRIELTNSLEVGQVDELIAGLTEASELEVAIGGAHRADLLAEGRLLQATLLAKRNRVPIVLRLRQELPPIEAAPRNALWKAARNDLSTLFLLEASERALDENGIDRREELLELARGNLRVSGGELGFGRERSLVALDQPGAPKPFRAFTEGPEQFRQIQDRLYELAKILGFDDIGEDLLETVTTFASEAIENTHDHATEDLAEAPITGIRFVQLRRHMVTRQRGMTQLPVNEGRLRNYLNRLAGADELGEERVAQFAELTIADSGVGIPAGLLRSEDAYEGPIAAEIELALRAMNPHESSKPTSTPGRGQGLKNALDAATALHGIVVFRAGRLTLTRDTTEDAPRGQEGWHIDESPYVPGTVVSMLLPWWRPGQARIAATTE